jgi:excinuclease ABC subunit B
MARSPENQGFSDNSGAFVTDFDTVAPVSWVPHKPERPEKSEGGRKFRLAAPYEPAGDQPTAIADLMTGINAREHDQVLLGVTGSGKTFTMA